MTFSKNPAVLEPTISPRGKRWFVILLALAASVRLYLLWRYYCISSDGVVYLRAAKDFYAGDIAGALASVSPRVVHVRNYGYGGNQKNPAAPEALKAEADIVVMLHPDYQSIPIRSDSAAK